MPKGVICAGALDGSNQAGAIVTCQAMTARPLGAGPPAAEAAVATAKIPSDSRTAATRRRSPNTVIQLLPLDRCFCQRPSGAGLSADLPGRGNRLGAALSAGRGAPIPKVFPLRLSQGHRPQWPAAGVRISSPAERPGRAHRPVIVGPVPAVIIRPVVVVARVPVPRVPIVVPIMRAMPAKAVPPAARFGRLRPEQPGKRDDSKRHKDLLHGILRGITPRR